MNAEDLEAGLAVWFRTTKTRTRPSRRIHGVVVRKLRKRWHVYTPGGESWHVPARMLNLSTALDPAVVAKTHEAWRAEHTDNRRISRNVKRREEARRVEGLQRTIDCISRAVSRGLRIDYEDSKFVRHEGVSVVGLDRDAGKVKIRSLGKASRIQSVWADSIRVEGSDPRAVRLGLDEHRAGDLAPGPAPAAPKIQAPEGLDDLPDFLKGRA